MRRAPVQTIHPLSTWLSRAVAALGSVALLAGGNATGGLAGVDPRIDDRIMIEMNGASTPEQFIASFESAFPTVDLTLLDTVPGRPVHLIGLTLPPNPPQGFIDTLEVALEAHAGGMLISGEFLYGNGAPEGKSGSTWVDSVAPSAFEQQYAKQLLALDAAHQRTSGAGTVVAVLDTGVDFTHPVLQGLAAPGGWDFVDGDASPSDEGNNADDDADGIIDEGAGHGTFVAGLIHLTAPGAKLLSVRILDTEGTGTQWLLVKGLYHAIDRGVEVINLSLGSTYDSVPVVRAIAEAATHGIIVTSSAGNFDRAEPREYPAMDDVVVPDPNNPGQSIEISAAFGVAALDHADVKADFSNYDDHLVLAAPGNTAPGRPQPQTSIVGPIPGGDFVAWEGTSFANAFVSGTAALIRAQHPEWPSTVTTVLATELVLRSTAVNIYPQNPQHAEDLELGSGRIAPAAATMQAPPAPELGDLNADGSVGLGDLLIILQQWGLVHSSADLDGSGLVRIEDVLILLNNWD